MPSTALSVKTVPVSRRPAAPPDLEALLGSRELFAELRAAVGERDPGTC